MSDHNATGTLTPEANALTVAGIRAKARHYPMPVLQHTAPGVQMAVAGVGRSTTSAKIEVKPNGSYVATIRANYNHRYSETSGQTYRKKETASRTDADPIVALHGAIVAVLAKIVRPGPTCDRVQCLTEARDNLARLLPGTGAP